MATDFRYVPTSGDLSGKSFEEQTQQAINEIGAGSEEANSKAEEAIALANNAIALAQNAVDTSQAANQAAQEAVTTANQANANVQGAYAAAGTAQARADQAYTTATTAAETAKNASLDATSATTTAGSAATLAQNASDKADTNATNIANLQGTMNALSSIFVTTTDNTNLDTLITPNIRRYFTGTLENSPVGMPCFFYNEVSTAALIVVQTIWNEDTPENIYRRKGEVDYTEDGPVVTWLAWTAIGSAGVPPGTITMWSGAIESIPTGWALCNGTKGTPDLTSKFVYGASATNQVGTTGGSGSHSHTAGNTTATNNATTLTTAMMPSHAHTQLRVDTGGRRWSLYGGPVNNAGADQNVGGIYSSGGGGSHTHTQAAHTHTVGNANSLPPYMILAYIMKL